MTTCKDCLYYEPCSVLNAEFKKHPKDFIETDLCAKQCTTFKDRSRFVELPNVGDTVYELVKINSLGDCRLQELKVTNRIIDTNGAAFDVDLLGKRFFLTLEEAEQALAERNQPDNTPQ